MSDKMPKQNARNPRCLVSSVLTHSELGKLNLASYRQLLISYQRVVWSISSGRVVELRNNRHCLILFFFVWLFLVLTDTFQALIQYPDVVTAQAAKLVNED